MSGAPYLEDSKKTLEEADRQVSLQLQDAGRLRTDPEKTIREREKILFEALSNAKNFYKKKEYSRAFSEWERACTVLDNEEFRWKVRALKESHENLAKANRELVDIKQSLTRRVTPAAGDVKFVDGSHETINSKVKNVYSHLSQQLRAERTPRTLSFWWPVVLALVILTIGSIGLKAYQVSITRHAAAVPISVPAPAAPSPVDDAFLQAQRNAVEKEMEGKMGDLKQAHQKEIADVKREAAQAAQGDRERVIQLETSLNEAQARNAELERRVQVLTEDSLNKDKTIQSLN